MNTRLFVYLRYLQFRRVGTFMRHHNRVLVWPITHENFVKEIVRIHGVNLGRYVQICTALPSPPTNVGWNPGRAAHASVYTSWSSATIGTWKVSDVRPQLHFDKLDVEQ